MNDLEFVGDYRNPNQLTARQRELGHDGQSDGDFTFGDFLDIINPLQHIPLVSTLYREITGDEISPHARIMGDTLFGGPSGFVAAAANVFFEEVAGGDIGETVMAFFSGEDGADDPQFAETGAAGTGGPNDAGLVVPAGLAAPPLTTGAGPAAAAPEGADLPSLDEAEANGMLTGQAALNALFNDLSGTPPAGPALPTAAAQAEAMPPPTRDAAAARSYPLPPRSTAVQPAPAAPPKPQPEGPVAGDPAAAVHPLILAQDAPDAAIAERMMEALDKYRHMSRQAETSRPAGSADRHEEARWQSDPSPDDPWRFDPATPPAGS